ncbi:MAG: hypothetical protein GX806_00685, partial [Lentisphaerae bacterium]|nr:hypothetical protein [Lentisphaerota bacterium]
MKRIGRWMVWSIMAMVILGVAGSAWAGEADINLPDLSAVSFTILGTPVSGLLLLYIGLGICVIGLIFGLIQYAQTKA